MPVQSKHSTSVLCFIIQQSIVLYFTYPTFTAGRAGTAWADPLSFLPSFFFLLPLHFCSSNTRGNLDFRLFIHLHFQFVPLVYLYFIYLASSLDIPPLLLLYSIYVFPAVLAICILVTPSSFTLFESTPLSPWFYPIGCHHAY